MEIRMKKFTAILFAVALLAIGFLAGFMFKSPQWKKFFENIDKFEQALKYVNREYIEVVDNDDLIDNAISGMLQGLDPHSFYIPKKEMQEVEEQMTGSFEGIGVEFQIVDDTIMVVSPIEGGPSEKLGIQSGDRIIKIGDKNVAGIGFTNNDVIKNLRGKKGTIVEITIKRPGINKNLTFKIERDKIPVYSVNYSYMINDEIGYIKVSRFAETTYNEFRSHLLNLKQKGLKNLILDLRGNPGGYLQMAYYMADEFLGDKKLIVYTEGRIPESNARYDATAALSNFEEGGLVILIDAGSASASEIVSGAVQDWDRGLIIGTRSFGKGLVQTQKTLKDGSAIRYVISKYYTPSGRCIQKPYDKKAKEYNLDMLERLEKGELFDESKIKLPDSLKYKTQAGRTVYGGGGIIPDVFVPYDTSGRSEYLSDLYANNIFRLFTLKYVEQNPNLKSQFKDYKEFVAKYSVNEKLLKEFTTFAAAHNVPFIEKDFKTSIEIIKNNLKAFIGRGLFGDDGFYPTLHQQDKFVQKAILMMPKAIQLAKTGKFEK